MEHRFYLTNRVREEPVSEGYRYRDYEDICRMVCNFGNVIRGDGNVRKENYKKEK